VTTKALI